MGGGEFELPEPLIQCIQSFLTGKEAAQTTILSKSWHNAWLTRPNLSFDENDFHFRRLHDFLVFVKKTVQRYEESNLRIESFNLRLGTPRINDDSSLIVNELIVKALKIGATDLTFQLVFENKEFVLSHEVFESENLIRLSLKGCKINDLKEIRCSRLESLSLESVGTEPHTILNIFRSCPLIANLRLWGLAHSVKLRVCRELRSLVCHSVLIADGMNNKPPMSLHKVRRVVLNKVYFKTLFWETSAMFPSLKELTLQNSCSDQEKVRISCRSLELLNFVQDNKKPRFEFDVPSIRKLNFEGSDIPSLSFEPTSSEWESHFSIMCHCFTASWFLELNKFFTHLTSSSKIYLSFDTEFDRTMDYKVEDIVGLTKQCEVEVLTMGIKMVPSTINMYAFLDGVFRLFRPKMIIVEYVGPTMSSSLSKKCNYVLCKILARGMNGEFSSPINFMYGLQGLEDVNVQISDDDDDEVDAASRYVPLKSYLDASTSRDEKQKTCFQLTWKPLP